MNLLAVLARIATSTSSPADASEIAGLIMTTTDPDSDAAKQAMLWITDPQPHIYQREAASKTFLMYYCNDPEHRTAYECNRMHCPFSDERGRCEHPLAPRY